LGSKSQYVTNHTVCFSGQHSINGLWPTRPCWPEGPSCATGTGCTAWCLSCHHTMCCRQLSNSANWVTVLRMKLTTSKQGSRAASSSSNEGSVSEVITSSSRPTYEFVVVDELTAHKRRAAPCCVINASSCWPPIVTDARPKCDNVRFICCTFRLQPHLVPWWRSNHSSTWTIDWQLPL